MELTLIRRPDGGFSPWGEESIEASAKIKAGRIVQAKVVQPRNYKFLQKFICLVQLGFDIWKETVPPIEYKGEPVAAVFARFRSDVTILAGYFTAAYGIDGKTHLTAKSISFAQMDESEFEAVFSNVLQVLLTRVLGRAGMTEEDVRAHVDRILQFDHQ